MRRLRILQPPAVAVATVGLAALLERGAVSLLGNGFPLMLFTLAVLAAAGLGGPVAGVLSALVLAVGHLPPLGSPAVSSASDRLRLALFLVEGVLICLLPPRRPRAVGTARVARVPAPASPEFRASASWPCVWVEWRQGATVIGAVVEVVAAGPDRLRGVTTTLPPPGRRVEVRLEESSRHPAWEAEVLEAESGRGPRHGIALGFAGGCPGALLEAMRSAGA